MAIYYAAKLYDKSGTYLGPAINSTTTEFTVQDILNSNLCVTNNITAIAANIGGTALSPSNSVKTGGYEGNYITDDDMYKTYRFYDVTPTPATLTSHGHIDTLHMRHIQETTTDYSAMRGPCPEGFHIPSTSEWKATRGVLVGLGISLSLNGPQLSYLKIPATGAYKYGGSLTRWNTVGQTRCCNVFSGYATAIYGFRDNDWSNSQKSPLRAIRPRKDVPVAPDNTWTTIFDGSSVASGAGIFWKEDQQIISLSSDGTNWITISDRNVGATQAGTEKNSACVGKVFQRGNNYGFTYNGDSSAPTFPNRTSTKIDVSGYGPSEYSSSTYYDGGSDQDWASVANNDLRGGVTGTKTVTIDRWEPVYYGPQPTLRTEAEILNATDLDTLMAELNAHPEEYHNMLLDGENCRLDNPCTSDSFIIMHKSPYDYYKICGVYINYTTYNNKWNWETRVCPI